jgi:superkiller protein 3
MRGLGISLFVAAGISLGVPPSAPAQQPRNVPQGPARRPHKVANPLNDLLNQAQAALDRKDYQDALEPLRKFVSEKPGVAYGHFQLAYAYSGLERWSEAQSEYRRAIELDPKLAAAYLNLGLLLLDRDAAAAIAPLHKTVELLPAESRPRLLLGLALERSGKLAEAAEVYQGAESLNPRDFETQFAFGRTLLRLDRPAEAEKRFRAALDLKSDSAPARLGLANALFVQHKPEAAAEFEA